MAATKKELKALRDTAHRKSQEANAKGDKKTARKFAIKAREIQSLIDSF